MRCLTAPVNAISNIPSTTINIKGNIIKSQLCTYPFTTIQANVIKSKIIIVESKKANKYLRLDNSHGNGANKNLKTKYGDKDTNSEKLVGMMFS